MSRTVRVKLFVLYGRSTRPYLYEKLPLQPCSLCLAMWLCMFFRFPTEVGLRKIACTLHRWQPLFASMNYPFSCTGHASLLQIQGSKKRFLQASKRGQRFPPPSQALRAASGDRVDRLLTHKSLSPLIIKGKPVDQFEPIKCRYSGNPKPINGYSADVLAGICEGMLEARDKDLLNTDR